MSSHSKQTQGTPADPAATWTPVRDSRLPETGRALAAALLTALPLLAAGGGIVYASHTSREEARVAAAERLQSLDRLLAQPPLPPLEVAAAAHGRDLFSSSCAACHGADGAGVQGLGKDLVRSWFVASLNDEGLVGFIRVGRDAKSPDNTTRMPMPPKGGHDELTDADLGRIATYLRGLQDPRRMPDLPAPVPVVAAAPSAQETSAFLAAAGGDAELAEYIASGHKLYGSSCAACHGKDARGVKGNGKDLVNSSFCKSQDDDSLLAFIKKGRDPGDPANTTGVGMPAKGGNPALSDDDILDIIAYVRSLQEAGDVAKN